MSSGKKSKHVSILMAALTKGPRHLRAVRSRSELIGSIFYLRSFDFRSGDVEGVCGLFRRQCGETNESLVQCFESHSLLVRSQQGHAGQCSLSPCSDLGASRQTLLHTLCPLIRMPAPRPMSEYYNFCHCSRHRRGSLFGHATHISSFRCAWQDNEHVQPVVIVVGCGPAKSRDPTARDSRCGCLLRCLPVGTSQHVVQFCVSCAAGPV